MPSRAPRPCSKPGCGTLTTQGRCHSHPFQPRQRGRQERQYDAARGMDGIERGCLVQHGDTGK